MNGIQQNRYAEYAKAYAGLFLEGEDDDKCMAKLVEQLHKWADEHAANGRDEQRAACLETASEIGSIEELTSTQCHLVAGATYMERCFLGRWGASGCPTLRPANVHWLASQVGTNVPAEIVSMLRLPWDAFAVEIPPELRMPLSSNGDFAEWIGVNRCIGATLKDAPLEQNVICMQVWSSTRAWSFPSYVNTTLGRLGDDLVANEDDDAVNLRALRACGKMVIGCLMALNAGQSERASAKALERRRRNGRFPSEVVFTVGKPVDVRMVDFVREYVVVGPRRMSGPRRVQTLVRGHWKHQVHGPRNSLRKFIHVEPYWRGPEDAPIAVRPHVLRAPAEQQSPDHPDG